MKLVQTKDYLLLLDSEAEIKRGDYLLEKESIINVFPDYLTDLDECKKIIAYRKLNEEAKELDLPELPPFEEVVDVEKLGRQRAMDRRWNPDSMETRRVANEIILAVRFGYKTAQSKQFSLEDMLDAFEYGLSKPEFQLTRRLKEDFEKFIQSLSTQQLPKEFIPEFEYLETCNCERIYPAKIKGCAERNHCKIGLKTITNSEGKQELVGKWIH